MDFPTPVWPPLNTIHTVSYESMGPALMGSVAISTVGSVAFAANQAYYVPFRIYQPATAVKMSHIVGSGTTGNVDVGIYDEEGNKMVSSGTTALGAASTIQTFDITDTTLLPGTYFMAIEGSSASGSSTFWNIADEILQSRAMALTQAVGSFPLPATATFSQSTTTAPLLPFMCVHFDTLV